MRGTRELACGKADLQKGSARMLSMTFRSVRERDSWSALEARHTAALKVIRSQTELDRELLLSYVIWPTEWIEAVVRETLAPAAA
jgi:hypothetical protein